ncbi:hypothetical protein GCM10019016_054150 [Streptomyces prasinosporus]|uniref:Histidine kinase n=1 Tax=Streptomyces prasinosporus TaxID=68256 RepID=A0ABP6TV01_9ACTN
MRRAVTTGALVLLNVLLIVPLALAGYLGFSFWHAERENDRRRQAAADALLRQARDAADRAADALTASRDTGADASLAVIREHTGSPLITHDADRDVFTAVAARSGRYDPERTPLGDPGEVERCFVHTYARRPGAAWTSAVAERDADVCRAGDRIDARVRSAGLGMADLDAERLTRAGVQGVLDPHGLPGDEDRPEARDVERKGRTVVALVLFRERYWTPQEGTVRVAQCYRLTRVTDPGGGAAGPVTAVPVSVC